MGRQVFVVKTKIRFTGREQPFGVVKSLTGKC